MSRFLQVYEPAEEGWGAAILQVGAMASLIGTVAGFAAGGVPAGLTMIGSTIAFAYGNGKLGEASRKLVDRILKKSKLADYIDKECQKAWKEVSKEYGKSKEWALSKHVSDKLWYDGYSETEGRMPGSDNLSGITNYTSWHNIKGWDIEVYADSDHIDGVKVCFQLKAKTKEGLEIEPYRLVKYTLPSPTNEDIKKMGYHKE